MQPSDISPRVSPAALECMRRGLTLALIGSRIGRATSTVSLMLSGQRTLHPDVLPAIAALADDLTARRVAKAIPGGGAGTRPMKATARSQPRRRAAVPELPAGVSPQGRGR